MNEASKKVIPTLLRFIARAFDVGQGGLGQVLGKSQSTVSRWLSGELVPNDEERTRIMIKFHEACALVHSLFPLPGNLHYLCSFAPSYMENRAEQASKDLRDCMAEALEKLQRGVTVRQSPTRNMAWIDLHIRAAALQNNARAHCFADDLEQPTLFVILVSDKLSLREQHIVAFEEAYAHVMNKLIDKACVGQRHASLIP